MALNLRDMTKRMMIGNIDIPLFIVMRPNPVHFSKDSKKRNSETYTNTGWVDTHWGNERDIIKVNGFTASRIGNVNQYKDNELLGASLKNSIDNLTYVGTDSHGPKQWAVIEQSLLKLEQIYKLDKEKIGSIVDVLKNGGSLISNIYNKIRKDTKPWNNSKRDEYTTARELGILKRASSFIIYNYTIYWGYFMDFSYEDDVNNNPRRYSYNFTFKVTKSSTDWLSESLVNNFPEARALNLFTQVGDITSYTATMLTGFDKMAKNIFL
ncbi:MAG: hypothetical protein NC222_06445 [Staphylococcus sp.]|nr:hypothetical protein [Staphylococcus sp.]